MNTQIYFYKHMEFSYHFIVYLKERERLYWLLHDHILVDDLVEEFEAVQVEDVDVSYLCPYQQLFTVVGQTAHWDALHTTVNTNKLIMTATVTEATHKSATVIDSFHKTVILIEATHINMIITRNNMDITGVRISNNKYHQHHRNFSK